MKFKAEDGTEWETHPAGEFVYDKDQLDLNAKLIRRVPQKPPLEKWAFAEYNAGSWLNLRADEIAVKGFLKAIEIGKVARAQYSKEVLDTQKEWAGV